MARFWKPPGSKGCVNVDAIASVTAMDSPEFSEGNGRWTLIFSFSNGSSSWFCRGYPSAAARDEALRQFCEFVGLEASHEPRLARRAIGGQSVLVVVGCSCGWNLSDADPRGEQDPEDLIVQHLAQHREPRG